MPDGTCMSDEEMKAYTAAANAAVTAAYNGTGGMIALIPRTEDAERLYVEDGEDVTELHLTLIYLGESADYDASNRQRLVDMAADWARQVGRPIEAKVFGFAHWNPYGDDPCWVYSVGDGGDLTRIHDRVWDAWRGSDPVQPLPPPQHTPWHPHIAVVYTAADNVNLNDLVKRVGNVTFDRIRVSFGQDVTDIPLFSPMASESESSS
jgi:2'-5' RNA ligase